MKPICRAIQEKLAAEGPASLRDDAGAQRHLEDCDSCFETLDRLAKLDDTLRALPAFDAPDAAVAATLARAAAGEEAGPTFAAPRVSKRPALAFLSAAAVAAIALVIMTPVLKRDRISANRSAELGRLRAAAGGKMVPLPAGRGTPPTTQYLDEAEAPTSHADRPPATMNDNAFALVDKERNVDALQGGRQNVPALQKPPREENERLKGLGYVSDDKPAAAPAPPPAKPEASKKDAGVAEEVIVTGDRRSGLAQNGAAGNDRSKTKSEADTREDAAGIATDGNGIEGGVAGGIVGGVPGGVVGGVVGGIVSDLEKQRDEDAPFQYAGERGKNPRLLRRVEPVYPEPARKVQARGVVMLEITIAPDGSVRSARVIKGQPLLDKAALDAVEQWRFEPTLVGGKASAVRTIVTVTFPAAPDASPSPAPSSSPEARLFLEELRATQGVRTRPATGYWANTYAPGDSELRLLQAQLAPWNSSGLPAAAELHEAALPVTQPFDAPRGTALALYLHADRRGIDGRSRVLLQVGLKAAERAGTVRPSMNVALVVDLRGAVPTETAAGLRALALALAQARQAGDRFSLVIAGRASGAVAVPAEQFKNGPLSVALDAALASPADGSTLADAVATAYKTACTTADRDAVLGASAVFVATGQRADDVDSVVDLAHQGAIAGVPLTAIGVGAGVPAADLDRLALAGQGARRVLDSRADAARLVDEELSGAGDTVARAIRLRIRLAKGVELVDVIGSHPLDEAQAQRVREGERAVDLQLARRLGLEADRGDDEDGIEIVIPAFRAGDAHTILLDVVAPGGGPIADVSARYKDLVLLRNGVARAELSLGAHDAGAGPLECNVLRNRLAQRLAAALRSAGDALVMGDVRTAVTTLDHERSIAVGIGALVPGLAADAGLGHEGTMLAAYAAALPNATFEARMRLADSLRYAARVVLLSRRAPLPGA